MIANPKRDQRIQETFKAECKLVCVEAISLANYLQIAGPFDNIVEKMRGVFDKKPDHFSRTHIHRALQLHNGHEFQKVVADVVASRYIPHIFFGAKFDFKKEIDAYQKIELLVLKAVAKAMAEKQQLPVRDGATKFSLISPPTGKEKYKVAFAQAHRQREWA